MFSAFEYRSQVMSRLTEEAGVSVEELALCMFALLLVVEGSPDNRLPGFSDDFWMQASELHRMWGSSLHKIDGALCSDIRSLFEDFYMLRENIYDGPMIRRVLADRKPVQLLERIILIEPNRVNDKYRLGNKALRYVLETVQEQIHQWMTIQSTRTLSGPAELVVTELLTSAQASVAMCQLPDDVWLEIRSKRPDIYAALRVRLESTDRLSLHA